MDPAEEVAPVAPPDAPPAAARGVGTIRAKLEVKRANGEIETHETEVVVAPGMLALVQKITADPQAQQALIYACIRDGGVVVALQRAVGPEGLQQAG